MTTTAPSQELGSHKLLEAAASASPSVLPENPQTALALTDEALDDALSEPADPPMLSEDISGNALLLRFMDSSMFSLYTAISYLQRYAGNLGIFFQLCKKIAQFSFRDIEFFLPQLVQVHVTVETESMALEDLLIDLCARSPHYTLLIFWQLQAHLTDLSLDPDSYGFHVCRRLYNKLQYMLFNVGDPPDQQIRDNVFPALILAGSIAAAFGLPGNVAQIKPLVVSQGRKKRYSVFHIAKRIAEEKKNLLDKVMKRSDTESDEDEDDGKPGSTTNKKNGHMDTLRSAKIRVERAEHHNKAVAAAGNESAESIGSSVGGAIAWGEALDLSEADSSRPSSRSVSRNSPKTRAFSDQRVPSSSSLHSNHHLSVNESSNMPTRRTPSPQVGAPLTPAQKIAKLRSYYFNCETQFVDALHGISSRLLTVPKQARLSALKAEIALLNKDLPANIDLPLLVPSTEGKLNQIVRIAPSEAVVLNSAEKVPFLLLIEYLEDEVDFDPNSQRNEALLKTCDDKKYMFDMHYLLKRRKGSEKHEHYHPGTHDTSLDNVDYADDGESGDIGELNVFKMSDNKQAMSKQTVLASAVSSLQMMEQKNQSSPRASDLSFSSSYKAAQPQVDMNQVTDIATHMRTAAIMLNQLDVAGSSKKTRDEVSAIKAKIVANMQSMEQHTIFNSSDVYNGEAGERKMENDIKIGGLNSDDPSAANLGEEWSLRKERIRLSSPFGHKKNWNLFSVIAKTGADLRQEAFACQLIEGMAGIWEAAKVNVWVKKMRILITNDSSGLVETITNGLSIHSIKKALTAKSVALGENPKGNIALLSEHFKTCFGEPESEAYKLAVTNFVRSLASYSLICYLLQIKDRHNGNILLDNEGHIAHIDFGFMLSNSPGSVGFEAAPFKFTQEYVDLMGGPESEFFALFKELLTSAFKAVRKESERIVSLVEMMAKDSNQPCFQSDQVTVLLRQRFVLHLSDAEVESFVERDLIGKSMGSVYTRLYDQFQLLTQGIYS